MAIDKNSYVMGYLLGIAGGELPGVDWNAGGEVQAAELLSTIPDSTQEEFADD